VITPDSQLERTLGRVAAGEAAGAGVVLYMRGLRLGLLYTPLSNPAGQPIQG
jgi:hypothetical protein